MNRRILTLIVALVPIVVFGVLLAVVTVPYVSLGPGPAFDTLGEVDGKQVVDIKGTQTHPTTGHLDMTTVSQRDELSLAEALTLWLSGEEQLMPRDLVYPPGSVAGRHRQGQRRRFQAVRAQRRVRGAGISEVPAGGHRRGGQRSRAVGGQAAGR